MLTLIFALCATAFAATGSVTPGGGGGTADKATGATTALPTEIDDLYKDGKVTLTALGNAGSLDADKADAFKDAYKAVKDATPSDMTAKYFFHQDCTEYPYTAIYKIPGLAKDAKVAAKLYNGSWTELSATNNGDETMSVVITGPGPVALFVGK